MSACHERCRQRPERLPVSLDRPIVISSTPGGSRAWTTPHLSTRKECADDPAPAPTLSTDHWLPWRVTPSPSIAPPQVPRTQGEAPLEPWPQAPASAAPPPHAPRQKARWKLHRASLLSEWAARLSVSDWRDSSCRSSAENHPHHRSDDITPGLLSRSDVKIYSHPSGHLICLPAAIKGSGSMTPDSQGTSCHVTTTSGRIGADEPIAWSYSPLQRIFHLIPRR
jgi:hypothetical protein